MSAEESEEFERCKTKRQRRRVSHTGSSCNDSDDDGTFFEKQQIGTEHCGMHALNNLLVPHGYKRLTTKQMQKIGSRVQSQVDGLMGSGSYPSAAIDVDPMLTPTGQYSADVLETVVEHLGCSWRRVTNPEYITAVCNGGAPKGRLVLGFLLCNSVHWWTIRKSRGSDFNQETAFLKKSSDNAWVYCDSLKAGDTIYDSKQVERQLLKYVSPDSHISRSAGSAESSRLKSTTEPVNCFLVMQPSPLPKRRRSHRNH